MKRRFSDRLAAFCLSLIVLVSCCAPYGFAAARAGSGEAEEAEIPESAWEEAEEMEEAEIPETEWAEAVEEAGETVTTEAEEIPAEEAVTEKDVVLTADKDISAVLNDADDAGLTDFSSFNHPDKMSIDEAAHTVTLDYAPGDHFVVYNGLDHRVNSFVWEADVDFPEGLELQSAALIFGFPSKAAPNGNWYGANLDSGRIGSEEAFRLFGPNIDTHSGGSVDGIDLTRTLHFKVDIHANGAFTYSFGNAGAELKTITGTISGWKNGGYLGILTFNSAATFSNITLEERDEPIVVPDFGTVAVTDGFQFNSNITTAADLSDLRAQGGTWEARPDGLYSNAVGQGDAFLYAQASGGNFVYSTDVKFLQNHGAAALLFRNADANGHDESYAVNIDAGSGRGKLWRWQDGIDNQLSGEIQFTGEMADNVCTLTVVAIDSWISFYVNGELLGSTADYYKLNGADRGQNTYIAEGTFGLLNWDGEMIFQNTVYTPLEGDFNPILSDITVTSSTGTVEEKGQFVSTEPITIQYVGNDASTVKITAEPVSGGAVVKLYSPDGTEYASGSDIPVSVGANYIAVESTVSNDGGKTATVTYRVNVHRRQAEAIYYNELYRDQYHYSVKDGWANDPNGLVYYNGTYHFFYQFYDDIRWGPMHWAHATSTDLIHWQDQPIAFYPDANGAMFSGCIVVDENNTSGLFEGSTGGLVALITANGNGQRIKLAYSTDEGRTWTKVDEIAADWSSDPLYNRDFRDPKVFRWENKWFMVVAGGPLRIYSSDNLREWTCESTYAMLHTECPDLYPIRADDGVVKWVLSRGGRTYKVGDLKQVDGHWEFVPDAPYANEPDNGIMNFGKDSYAAMTYYVQDFGTAANPTLPDIIELNWMNTWDDYCNQVAEKTGQAFNGTFNLNLKLGLKNEGGKYVLTQTPIEAYEELRGEPLFTMNGEEISENRTLDFSGDCYEIVSKFYPGTAAKVGFDLRTGDGEKTAVRYDVAEKRISIDRSQSGIIISNLFSQTNSQTVEPNADGSIDLRIYVDRASVEVFAKDYTVAGANQIFPSVSSLGTAIVSEGGTARADVAIYPLESAWTEKVSSDVPVDMISSSSDAIYINTGDALDLQATLLPVNVAQNIDWTISDETILSGDGSGNSFHVTALKAGSAAVTATASANPDLQKMFSITITDNNFDTNIPSFTANGGNWIINGETLSVSNQASNHFYMSANPVEFREFTLETNIRYTSGAINLFFAAAGIDPFNPQAYAVQFNDSDAVRLFRFGGDDITPAVSMGKRINDGEYHNVKIVKSADSVTVSVDNTEYLAYTFDSTENFFNDGVYVGLGLWDGALDVQTFRLTDNAAQPEIPTATPTNTPAPVNTSTPVPTTTPASTPTPVPTPADQKPSSSQGCYVATAVYGSYDCPEVWTLRRFRDEVLAETWYGRLFIHAYYAVSPTAVKLFGDCDWFQNFFRGKLDNMVANLQEKGFESTPYQDRAW